MIGMNTTSLNSGVKNLALFLNLAPTHDRRSYLCRMLSRMLNAVFFYCIVKPLSWLPIRALLVLSDGLYVLIYRVIGYRRGVVRQNIERSFPDRGVPEWRQIERDFYRHFCDMIVETIRNFSISRARLRERCRLENPSVLEPYARSGRSVIIAAGHHNNWEMPVNALAMQIPHELVGIYAPIGNAYLDRQFFRSRARYGMVLKPKQHAKQHFEENRNTLTATLLIGDQSPSNNRKKLYWTTFLHQPTGVMLGTEKFARQYDLPVLWMEIRKVKRGYYRLRLRPLEDHPSSTPDHSITDRTVRALETQIRAEPAFYLWSHRRWKLRPPRPLDPPPLDATPEKSL